MNHRRTSSIVALAAVAAATTTIGSPATAHAAVGDSQVRAAAEPDIDLARALLVEAEAREGSMAGAVAAFDAAPLADKVSCATIATDSKALMETMVKGNEALEEGHGEPRSIIVRGVRIDVAGENVVPGPGPASVSFPDVVIQRKDGIEIGGIPVLRGTHYHTFTPSRLSNKKCAGSYAGIMYGFDVKASRHQWKNTSQTHCEIHCQVTGPYAVTFKTHTWGNRAGKWWYERRTL